MKELEKNELMEVDGGFFEAQIIGAVAEFLAGFQEGWNANKR